MTLQQIIAFMKRSLKDAECDLKAALSLDTNASTLSLHMYSTDGPSVHRVFLTYRVHVSNLEVEDLEPTSDVYVYRTKGFVLRMDKKVKGEVTTIEEPYEAGDIKCLIALIKKHKIKHLEQLHNLLHREGLVEEDTTASNHYLRDCVPVMVAGHLKDADLPFIDTFMRYRIDRPNVNGLIIADGWASISNGSYLAQRSDIDVLDTIEYIPLAFSYGLLGSVGPIVSLSKAKSGKRDCTHVYCYGDVGSFSLTYEDLKLPFANIAGLHTEYEHPPSVPAHGKCVELHHPELYDVILDIKDGEFDDKLYLCTEAQRTVPHHKMITFAYSNDKWCMRLGLALDRERLKSERKNKRALTYTEEDVIEAEKMENTVSVPVFSAFDYDRRVKYKEQEFKAVRLRFDYLALAVTDFSVDTIHLKFKTGRDKLIAYGANCRSIVMGYSD